MRSLRAAFRPRGLPLPMVCWGVGGLDLEFGFGGEGTDGNGGPGGGGERCELE